MAGETLPSLERVRRALLAEGLQPEIVEFAETTRSAAEAAAAIGCPVAAIAKSLVFRALSSDRPVLVVASGANRVDEAKLAAALGEAVGRADAAFVRARTGFAIGGVAPVGHTEKPVIFIDAALLLIPTIWAAAGKPNAVFPLSPETLLRLTGGRVVDVA